ncbi:PH domain-containing protein [Polaribacter sp. OB-PA-B3]
MDNINDFSQFRRQSKKGIIVIYLNLIYKFLKAFWILLFLFIQKFSKITQETLLYIYLGVAVLLIFLLIRAYLIFKNFKFKVEDKHFVLQKGIIKKTNTSIPFDRIQNINFKQNIIQQIINVHEVNVETAGSSKAEISIKALTFKDAKDLKNIVTIINKKQNLKADQIEIEEEKPLLKIGFLSLLKVSLTENHLQSLLLLFALLVGFFQQVNDLFKGLGKKEELSNFISNNTSALKTSVILIISLLVFLSIVAVISSIVRVFLRHFNLTMYLKNNAFEIYQGLTTKNSVVLKKEKVQHITISHNPVKKKLGISFITFKQAVSGKVNKKKDKSIKIVGCESIHITAIKNLLFPKENLNDFNKNKAEPYYRFRLYNRSFIFFIILNLGFYFGIENVNIFWLNIILLPIFVFSIELNYKKRYYYFNDNIIMLARGTVETHKTFLPFFKVQNITLKQNIFQVNRGVADIVFQTASGKVKIPCISFENANKIYNYTLFKIESSSKSWM